MDLLVLSPHFDDAVYSLGGLLHQQAQAGRHVVVLTVCGGGPDPGHDVPPLARELHDRWAASAGAGDWLAAAAAQRRSEDEAALAILGVEGRALEVADCIYRRDPASGQWLCPTEASLFAGQGVREPHLARRIAADLAAVADESGAAVLAPLGVGNHLDHRLVRRAAEETFGAALGYYEEFPYAAESEDLPGAGAEPALAPRLWPLAPGPMAAWKAAARAYASQVSTFWPSPDALESELHAFAAHRGAGAGAPAAVRTWHRTQSEPRPGGR